MNATSGGLSLPLGSEPLTRFGRLRRLKARACAMLATAALVAVPALVTVNVVNAPTAAAATTCSPSAGTSISSITQFDFLLADRTLVSGTTNTVGAVYRYSQADPDNLYDVLVTIESIVDGDGNTAGGQFTNPNQDRQTAPVPAAVAYMDTPVWDFRTGGGSGVQTSTMRLRYDFVATGTNTPVTLNVIATTVDNDGAGYADNEGTIATVQEFVKYDTLPDAWLKATTSAMNPQADGTVLGLPGTLPGITPEATASIGGVYLGTSSVTWTAGHIMTYVASNPGDASGERMSALSFRCEPAAQGVLSPDLKLTKTLDTAGTIFNGQTITYTLTPSNVGFADAAAGWSVTEVPPAGLTITSMSGTGYTCDVTNPIRKCTSATALPGDTVAAPITVTAQVTASPGTSLRNVAYVSPVATATVPELIPLGTPPTNATNTDSTATNNDAQAIFSVGTPSASISLVKSITGVADTNGDGWIGIGDTVSYKFVVTNTGNVTLAPVTITDTKLTLTGAACVPTLAAGASADCSTTGSYVIQQSDITAGGVVNSATASGTPPGGLGLGSATDVSDTGTAPTTPATFTTVTTPATTETAYPAGVTQTFPNSSTNPTEDPTVLTLATPVASISLVKSITGVADTNGDGWIGVGDTVSYTFVVTNTGNVTLAPVTITDDVLLLTDAACVDSLAAGATAECSTTGSHVIQQADVDAGGVVNTATTTGTPPVSTGLSPVSDVSDTGTAPDGPGAFTGVDTPEDSETAIPAGVSTAVGNDAADPTEDPTVLTLATPVASISLVKSITGVVDTTGDGWIGVGDTVSYTFVVTNTGNVTLAPVTITDDVLLLTDAACVDSLAAGATAECSTTGSHVIQQADVDAGGVVNTATTTGTPPPSLGLDPVTDVSDTGTAPSDPGAFTSVDTPEDSETAIPGGVTTSVGNDAGDPTEDPTVLTLATPVASIELVKSITGVADTNGDGWIGIGDTVSYKFVVTNTGNVTLAPVTITDTTLGLTEAACADTLAAGASVECSTTGSYVIQQSDIAAGGVVNTATTAGTPPASTGLADVSDVSDTGTAPDGPGAFAGVDTPGTTETAYPTGLTTTIENSTTDPTEDPTVLTLATPVASIVLVKSITGVVDTTGDGWIGVGDTVSYKFVVTNTGNVALAPVTITDDTLGLTDAACVPTLAAGASADCSTTGSYVIQQADVDAGGVVNTATTTGTPPPSSGLAPVSDVSDTGTAPDGPGAFTGVDTPGTSETAYPTGLTTTIQNSTTDPTEDPTVLSLATPVASISLVKSISGVVDTTGDGWIGVGDTVSYTFVVTNTGNVTLAPVTITDDVLLLTDAACVDSLAAGATAECSTTGSHVIQQSDVDAGGVVNTATTTGTPPVSTGLSPVSDVSDTGTAPDGPGAFTGVDTPEDSETAIPAGVSTAVGNDAADPTEDPTVLTLATPVASITLTKRVTGVLDTNGSGAVDPGDTITYAFSVTNTGNVTLAPVTVSDDMLGLTDAACVPTLAAGASADCSTTGSYVITEDDLLAGGVVNTATATGTPPSWSLLTDVTDVSDTGTEPSAPGQVVTVDGNETAETAIPAGVTTAIGNDPAVPGDDPTVVTLPAPVARIVLVKSVSGVADSNGSGAVDAGDTVSYTFSVTNTGNVTLAPVTVSDDLLGLTDAACVDSLASGATLPCSTTGSYVITEADLFAGGVVNTATASGVPPVASGLEPVSDVSDTGTEPTAPGVVAGVDGPEGVETPIPAGVSTSIVNDGADLGEDPTVVTLPAPVASIVLVKSVTGVVDTTGDGLIGVGDTVSYAFSVTNTGNVTLAPVTVSDDMLGLTDAACVPSLAPRETLPCSTTGSYVLLQADVDAGGVENTATATGVPPAASGLDPVTDVSDTGTTPQGDVVDEPGVTETGNPLAVNPNDPAVPGDDPTTALITPVARIVLVKSVSGVADSNGSGAVDAGDTVSYTFSVTNTGNVTLAPVTVSDDLLGLTDAACVDSLASGATLPCSTTGSYVITEADLFAGGVVNTATASGVPPVASGLEPVSDVSDTGTEPTAPGVVAGVDGPEGVETPIPAGVSTSIVNDGADLGEDPTVVTLPAPVASIVLVKSVTGVVDTTGDGLIGVGDTVSYAFSVTNTGNVTLAPVTVSDDMLGLTDAACVPSLAPRETLPCSTTGSYVLLQADVDAGGVENTATATGVPPAASGLDPVTDVSDTGTTPQGDVVDEPGVTETGNPLAVNPNDPAVPGDDPTTALITPVARIVLVKSVSGVADSNGSGAVDAGDTVSYTFSVTNTGNVTLAPVTVSDDLLGLTDAACVDSLASGATLPCSTTGSYVITEADLFAGGVVNTATASGVPPVASGLEPVSDVSDTGTEPTAPGVVAGVDGPEGVETPIPAGVSTSIVNDGADLGEDPTVVTLPAPVASIVLVKSVTGVVDTTGDGLIGVGDTVSYAFSVTNTGNVTLAPVTVSDDMLGLTDAACVPSLAPRETLPCSTTGSYVLLQADVDAGGVENTATATGVPPAASGLDPVTDVSDTGTTPQGDVVDEPGVTETGNPLAVNPNDPAVPGDDPTTALITPVARIVLVKSVSGVADSNGSGAVDAGDTVSYTFSVTNTGNVTLAPVTVSDDLLGLTDAACVDSLASGATLPCSTTGSYVITEADLFAGGVVNTATASGVPPVASGLEPVSDVSDTGTEPTAPGVVAGVDGPEGVETPIPAGVSTSIVNDGADLGEDPTVVTLPAPVASIVLVKSVTGVVDTTGDGLIGVGDTVSYAFSVTNTGNVTLAPVTVSDDMLGLTDAACVPSLAPRETLPCSTTGSYVLLQADVDAGGVENTATATGVPPAAAELEPVTDTSDAGTTPSGPGTVSTVTTPGSTETPNPTGVTTSVPNDSEDPTEDPTALTLATPVAKIVLWKSISAVADTTGDGWLGAGDTITYTFTVKNTGNVPLAPVTVTDAMLGFTDAACVDTLAAGATGTCVTTASYVITAADVAAGGVANTAVTTGTPPAAYQLANVTDVSDTGTAPGGPGEYGEVTDPDSTETAIPAGVTTSVTNNGSDPTDDPTVLTLTERTPMPNTGSDSVPLVLGGLGLMLAGLVLVLLARRRRKTA